MAFNDFQFGTNQFNDIPQDAPVVTESIAWFGGFALSDLSNITVTDIDDNAPTRQLITGNIPRGHGAYVTGDFWRPKKITLSGYVKQADWPSMETYLDTIRAALRKREQNLDIIRNGVLKRYTATWTNPDTVFAGRAGYNVNLVKFVLEFTTSNPFGFDKDYSISSLTFTTSPTNQVITQAGTIEARPIFTLNFTAANTVTVVDIQNLTTGDEIQFTGSVIANDILEFDSEKYTLTNLRTGLVQDFKGSFPILDVGNNIIQFTVTGTSFNVTATIKWKNAWL